MSWTRPTLAELVDSQISEIEARLPGADSRLRASVLNVLARVVAGALHLFYGFLAWVVRQLFIDTAEDEYLDRHARIWLPGGRNLATLSTGTARFTGTVGKPVVVGTALTRADSAEYVTTAAASIQAGGYVDVPVASLAVGLAGNCDAGTQFTVSVTLDGVVGTAIVQAPGMANGNDDETSDSLRGRVKSRIQNPPQGGAGGDYVGWARDVPGVTRAWELPNYFGLGTVAVLFVRDGDPLVIPDAAKVATVQAHIDLMRPVTSTTTVMAPLALPVLYQIKLTPGTDMVKQAVIAALQDLHAKEAVPGGTLLRSHIDDAISQATGETDHTLVSPGASVTTSAVQMATYGGVTWL